MYHLSFPGTAATVDWKNIVRHGVAEGRGYSFACTRSLVHTHGTTWRKACRTTQRKYTQPPTHLIHAQQLDQSSPNQPEPEFPSSLAHNKSTHSQHTVSVETSRCARTGQHLRCLHSPPRSIRPQKNRIERNRCSRRGCFPPILLCCKTQHQARRESLLVRNRPTARHEARTKHVETGTDGGMS